jgi:hypothetical protein
MRSGTGLNVYLIRQDIDRLYGEYLVRAVVIAAGAGRAVKALPRHIRAHHPAAVARRTRLTALRIGDNAPAGIDPSDTDRPGEEATVVAVVLGEDDGA